MDQKINGKINHMINDCPNMYVLSCMYVDVCTRMYLYQKNMNVMHVNFKVRIEHKGLNSNIPT